MVKWHNKALQRTSRCNAALAVKDKMKLREIEIADFEEFIQLMNGSVFHTTTLENYESILFDRKLIPNTDGTRASIFGNSNGFFRVKGYVSFFDYRNLGDEKVNQHINKCIPTSIIDRCGEMVILVLSNNALPHLVSWELWEAEKAYSLKIVPRIEIGYPSFVPLSQIKEVIIVRFHS